MKKINLIICLIISFTTNISCSKSTEHEADTVIEKPDTVNIILNPSITYQTITGFGGANKMWGSQTLSTAEAVKTFGTDDGQLGLSVFRVRLSSNKNDWPIIVNSVKEANKYGVKVLACPWSPPAALKSNKSDIGGYLLPENYKAFKDYINEFLAYMTANGAKIDVVSIQNEPDIKVSYESCDYTATDFINFFNAPGEIVGAKVAAPESFNFSQTLTNSILSNDLAASKISIVAGHTYGGGTAKFPLAEQKNKEIWMTEYFLNLETGTSGSAAWSTYSESSKWNESIKMLVGINDAMTSNWNAYIWWYLKRYYSFIGDGEQGTVNGEVLKRGVAYSHFSKFVRPGAVRIDAVKPTTSTLKITAYKKDNQTQIIIINTEINPIKDVKLSGLKPISATSYTSTLSESLVKKEQNIINNAISIDVVPAKSVITILVNN
jgi:glucuronoarabinoxylan endo-1,4-beta-xylanase